MKLHQSTTDFYPSGRPVLYVDGIDQFDQPSSHPYWKHVADSHWKSHQERHIGSIARTGDSLWKDQVTELYAQNIIRQFITKKTSAGSITPLWNFEIYLLNDDFKCISFCELNAFNPGFTFVSDRVTDTGKEVIYEGIKGTTYRRAYVKDDLAMGLGFGIGSMNFYVERFVKENGKNKTTGIFQLENEYHKYEEIRDATIAPRIH